MSDRQQSAAHPLQTTEDAAAFAAGCRQLVTALNERPWRDSAIDAAWYSILDAFGFTAEMRNLNPLHNLKRYVAGSCAVTPPAKDAFLLFLEDYAVAGIGFWAVDDGIGAAPTERQLEPELHGGPHTRLRTALRSVVAALGITPAAPLPLSSSPPPAATVTEASNTEGVKPKAAPATEAKRTEGEKLTADGERQRADQYKDIRAFAKENLKGQERATVEALCDAGGELPIADLALKPGVSWAVPFEGFKGTQRRLHKKTAFVKRWRLERKDNVAHIVFVRERKRG